MKLYATLYHGAGVDFGEADLLHSSDGGMEFGTEFYTTPDFDVAKRYATLSAADFPQPKPVVIEYDFNIIEAMFDQDVDVRKFDRLDLEWFNFVSDNLHNKEFHNNSTNDIIIGPLEKDDAWDILKKYSEHKISYEEAAAQIEKIDFKYQVVFKTNAGLKYLKRTGEKEIL